MKKTVLALAGLLALAGCTPALSPTADARAKERAAVALAKSSYMLAADACIEYIAVTHDAKVAAVCQATLDPAHDLILDASKAVDTVWTSAAACNLVQGASLVAAAVEGLGPVGATLKAAATDTIAVAAALSGVACASSPAADAAPAPDAGQE